MSNLAVGTAGNSRTMDREMTLSRKTTMILIEPPTTTRTTPQGSERKARNTHLGLTMPARMTGSKLSRSMTKVKPFNPEDDYCYDSSGEEDKIEAKLESMKYRTPGARVYGELCHKYRKVPAKYVMRQFGKSAITIKRANLDSREFKAFFVALVRQYIEDYSHSQANKYNQLTSLELDENYVGLRQMGQVVDFASSHQPLTKLALRGCHVCGKGLRELAEFTGSHRTLRTLDLSDNNLDDNAVDSLVDIIEYGESIHSLILRGNKLGECGTQLGEALGNNDSLRYLDLSWNHIRGKSAAGICKGVAGNTVLETLILAWNGFGHEGCVAMATALQENTCLETLDLSNNRIHNPALFELIKGVEKNKALSTLRLGYNPITSSMSSVLLTKIGMAKESNLKELDLKGIVVDKEFNCILREIQNSRMFLVRYDQALPLTGGAVTGVDHRNMFNIDPIRILYYMKEHLRTIDLFLKVNKDGDNVLSKDEMKYAFEMEGFPITEKDLEVVMDYLSRNRDGDVDLMENVNGERRLKREIYKEDEDEQLREKENDETYSKVFSKNGEKKKEKKKEVVRRLPPLNKPRMGARGSIKPS